MTLSELKVAKWKVYGPCFFSSEGDDGYLGVDYTDNVDTRWGTHATLGPLINTVDLSAVGGTTADSNGAALANGMHATKYIYVIRGTDPARIQASNMAATDPGISLAEAATSIIYTKSANGTELISLGMDNTVYRNITVITPAGSDTTTAEAEKWRIFGYAGSSAGVGRIAAAGRGTGTAMNLVSQNTLSGSVTMDAPNWTTRATFAGEAVVFTGFQLDGDLWIVMTDNGPYYADANFQEFRPIIDEIGPNSENGRGSSTWSFLGVICPSQRGTRFIQNLDGYSIGPGRFLQNTSPVQGFTTATCGSERWLWWVEYNPVSGNSYLLAARPRRSTDNHAEPLSFYTIATFASKRSNFLMDIDTYGGRTLPTIIGGYGSDIFYLQQGRLPHEHDDTSYEHAATGTLFLTELRRDPEKKKHVEYAVLETADCDSDDTVILNVAADGGTSQKVGYTINSPGFHKLEVGSGEQIAGCRLKPELVFARSTASSAPEVIGELSIYYREEDRRFDSNRRQG